MFVKFSTYFQMIFFLSLLARKVPVTNPKFMKKHFFDQIEQKLAGMFE